MKAALVALLVSLAPAGAIGQDARGYAAADSADMADEALAGVDVADVADVTEELMDAGAYPRSHESRVGRFARVETVAGYRSSSRLAAGLRGVAVSVLRTDAGTERWLDVQTGGVLERVTVGGLRPRVGESLVLGARYSRFGSLAGTSGEGGLEVTPSLARSRPKRGVGVRLRRGPHRLTAAAWKVPDGSSGRWVSIARTGSSGAVFAAAGKNREAADLGGRTRSAVSLGGTRRIAGGVVACEVAWLDGAALAALRADVAANGEWTAAVYTGSTAATGGVAWLDGPRAREGGADLSRRGDWGRWRSTLSFHTALRRTDAGERVRRRVDVRVVHAWSSERRLDLTARYDFDAEHELPSGPLAESVADDRSRRGRFRARLDVPAGGSVTLRYRAEALLEPAIRPGYVAGLEVRHDGRLASLRVSATDFALPGRSSGYVARPGIAGYESVTVVSRRGSDVAARATLRAGFGTTVSFYAGVPWRREPRYLVSFQWRL